MLVFEDGRRTKYGNIFFFFFKASERIIECKMAQSTENVVVKWVFREMNKKKL